MAVMRNDVNKHGCRMSTNMAARYEETVGSSSLIFLIYVGTREVSDLKQEQCCQCFAKSNINMKNKYTATK